MFVFLTSTLLSLKKPKSPFEMEQPNLRTMVLISKPLIVFIFVCVVVSVWFISGEEFALFISFALIIYIIEICIWLYYITKTPKLKQFVTKTFHHSKTKVGLGFLAYFVEICYEVFKFYVFCGQMTTWPKRKDVKTQNNLRNPEMSVQRNQVAPI